MEEELSDASLLEEEEDEAGMNPEVGGNLPRDRRLSSTEDDGGSSGSVIDLPGVPVTAEVEVMAPEEFGGFTDLEIGESSLV